MDLLGLLGINQLTGTRSLSPDAEVDHLLDAYLEEPRPDPDRGGWDWQVKPEAFGTGRALLEAGPALQVRVLLQLAQRLVRLSGRHVWRTDDFTRLFRLRLLASALVRRRQTYTRDDVRALLTVLASDPAAWTAVHVPMQGYLRSVERWVEEHGLDEDVRRDLERLKARGHSHRDYAGTRKAVVLIDQLLAGGATKVGEAPEIVAEDDWGHAATATLAAMPEGGERRRWLALLAHAQRGTGARPSATWARKARELVEALGPERFRALAALWLGFLQGPSRGTQYLGHQEWRVPSALVAKPNAALLTGLAWACAPFEGADLAQAIGDAALAAFSKLPGIGARSAKVGNACIYTLGVMPGLHGVAQLQRLRRGVKYAQAQALIETAFRTAAERAGYSRDDLEDLAVPAQIADKDLEAVLAGQRDRLERLFLVPDRSWSLPAWRERFVDQPLVSRLARRLIWRFEDPAGRASLGAWLDGAIVGSDDQALGALWDETTQVRLWHPISSASEEVLSWRRWLERHAVTQPFKQAHREVYLLTEAERQTATYSNRFAAHILRQHQLKALCEQRGWRMRLQGGGFDPGDCMPRLELPRWDLSAEFWVQAVEGQESGAGICLYVSTDQVRFGHLDTTPMWVPHATMRLDQVPSVVFSEVMRDVDLFVGVCSVGNDPTWADAGPLEARGYWSSYAFGELAESAKTRRTVLERLLPRLAKLDGRWSLSQRFLVIRGELRTYKIHLGSGNILMEPNDQYLCIVPGRGKSATPSTDGLRLPFEGDALLSIILSKALLLAEDRAIKDPTITRQIRASFA